MKTTFANLIQTRSPIRWASTTDAEIRNFQIIRPTGYDLRRATKVNSTQFENVSWKSGGSGIATSALDLALFGHGVVRNRYSRRPAPSDVERRNGKWARARVVVELGRPRSPRAATTRDPISIFASMSPMA